MTGHLFIVLRMTGVVQIVLSKLGRSHSTGTLVCFAIEGTGGSVMGASKRRMGEVRGTSCGGASGDRPDLAQCCPGGRTCLPGPLYLT